MKPAARPRLAGGGVTYSHNLLLSFLYPPFAMTFSLPLRPLLLAAVLGLATRPAAAQAPAQSAPAPKAKPSVTTVYLVRHAEKDSTSNPADPTLSAVGRVRAQALRQLLARRHPVALFTTNTVRTRATLAPLAEALKLEPQVYDPRETTALAVRLRQEYRGKAVVVVGHSNTLLPLIESLGGTPPVEEIGENEYDYLFTVRVSDGTLPTVGVRGYGPERKLAAAAKAEAKGKGAAPAPSRGQ